MTISTEKIIERESSDAMRCETHDCELTPSVSTDFYGRRYVTPAFCPQCQTEERARVQAIEELRRAEEAAKAFRVWQQNADVPRRYIAASIDDLIVETPDQAEIQQHGRNFVQSGGVVPSGLICIGGVGGGKTYFGCACANGFLRANRSVRYTTGLGLVRKLRSTWGSGPGKSEEQIFRQIATVGLLVLDEIGAGANTPAELGCLISMLDARYANMKPTIIIGNVTMQDLIGLLSERIIDRFRQGGKTLVFDWPSRRGIVTDPEPGPDVTVVVPIL